MRALSFLILLMIFAEWPALFAQSVQKGDQGPAQKVLKKELTSEEPSKASLKAFESRAEQKLKDLGEYLEIASDSSYSKAFRKRAAEQAIQLFDHGEEKLEGFPLNETERSDTTVQGFFQILVSKSSPLIETRFRSIGTSPLEEEKEKKARYRGELRFELICEFRKHPEEEAFAQRRVEMEGTSILKKVAKRFGDEEEEVWEVFLGSLRTV